jgi:hypothetical protein
MRTLLFLATLLALAAGQAAALTAVVASLSWTYGEADATHGPATGATVYVQSEGGAPTEFCTATAPTATCTGDPLPTNHTYTFTVKATNSDGVSGESPATILGTFSPPDAPAITLTYPVVEGAAVLRVLGDRRESPAAEEPPDRDDRSRD